MGALLALGLLPASLPAGAAQEGCCPSLDGGEWARESTAPGTEHLSHHFDALFGARQNVNVLVVDLTEPDVDVRFAAARAMGEDSAPLSALADEGGAVAAINGGFAHGGPGKANSGILKISGEVLPFLAEEPEELRFVGSAAVGIDGDGGWHFRERPGRRWPDDWDDVEHALAGGHALVRDGDVVDRLDEQRYRTAREEDHAGRRHPRTALGMTEDSVLVLVTVDGRHEESAGLTLRELAHLMTGFEAQDALNLDGGGSTTMWRRGEGVVNRPSDNGAFDHRGERKIRSAVLVRFDRDF